MPKLLRTKPLYRMRLPSFSSLYTLAFAVGGFTSQSSCANVLKLSFQTAVLDVFCANETNAVMMKTAIDIIFFIVKPFFVV